MRGWTPDQVEQGLLAEERIIAQARARQMALLGLADAMQLPTADGCRTMREWVAGRLDISVESATRLTATANRLREHPTVAHQLEEGEITFDRAEALSRIPDIEANDRLAGVDIRGLHRLAALHKRTEWDNGHETHREQYLAIQPNLDESSWKMWARLDGYAGHVVDKVLAEAADTVPDLPDGTRPGLGYRRAVALATICEDRSPASVSTPTITVFVDEHGAEVSSGTAIGPEILDRIACAASLEVIKTADGRSMAVGRRSRIIPTRLRRFVLHRDGDCTADGCTSRYRLEVHHKVPWSEGGPTDPENLTTLCWFHHHIVIHGWGFRIDERLGAGRLRFIRPGSDPPSPGP
jgi:hypothetical protein